MDIFNGAVDFIGDLLDSGADIFENLIGDETGIISGISDAFQDGMNQVINWGSDTAGSAMDQLLAKLIEVIKKASEVLASELDSVGLGISGIAERLKSLDIVNGIVKGVNGLFGSDFMSKVKAGLPRRPEGTAVFKQIEAPEGMELPEWINPNRIMSFGGSEYKIGSFTGSLFDQGLDHPWAGIKWSDTDPWYTKLGNSLLTIAEWLVRFNAGITAFTNSLGEIGDIYIGRSMKYWANWEMQNELCDVNTYLTAYRRDLIPKNRLQWALKSMGYSDGHIDLMLDTTKFFPSPNDLIDLSVKEAFDSREKLLIHNKNALPEDFLKEAPRSGLDKEWAERYWHAHWRLIPKGDLDELRRRDDISNEEYLRRLKLLDFDYESSILQRKLLRTLINRVDSRRLFDYGLISESELTDLYLAQGYNTTDTKKMVSWNKQERSVGNLDLRELAEKEFKEGLINETEFALELVNAGLDSDEALERIKFVLREERLNRTVLGKRRIISYAKAGKISLSEAESELTDLGIVEREINEIITEIRDVESLVGKIPTLTDLKRWVAKGLIGKEEFTAYLERLNTDQREIDLYTAEVFGE